MKNHLTICGLMFISMLSQSQTTLLIQEDFNNGGSSWTEYDPDSKLDMNQRVNFDNWIRTERGWINRPVEFISDFQLDYDFSITGKAGNAKSVGPLVSDVLGSISDLVTNKGNGIWIQYYAGYAGGEIYIQPFIDGVFLTDALNPGTKRILVYDGTTYYATFIKSGNQLTLSLFSNPQRTIHVPGSPISISANFTGKPFNQFYAVNSNVSDPSIPNWEWTTGWIDNIELTTNADLVLHLSAEHGFVDLSPKNQPVSQTNVTIVDTPWGGKAFKFDGTASMEIPDVDNSLDFTGDFTIEMLLRIDEDYDAVFLNKWNGTISSNLKNLSLEYGEFGGGFGWGVGGMTSSTAGKIIRYWDKLVFIKKGDSLLYSFGYNPDYPMALHPGISDAFINGVNDNPLLIGKGFSTCQIFYPMPHYLKGQIEDLKIYKRALNKSEIEPFYLEQPYPPNQPWEVRAFPGNAKITLKFPRIDDENIISYRIYRGSEMRATDLINTVPATDTLYIDQNLVNGQPYFYRLTMVDKNGSESGYSPPCWTTPSPTPTVGYWKFNELTDGKIPDLSGFGQDGSVYGAILSNDGHPGKALSFDGTDDYAELPAGNAINYVGRQMTVEAMVNVKELTTRGWVFGRFNNWLITINNDATVEYAINCCGTTRVPVDISLNEWHHLSLVYDGNKMKFYLDYKEIHSVNRTDPVTFQNGPVVLGKDINQELGYFSGLIDELRISNVALSPDEFLHFSTSHFQTVWSGNGIDHMNINVVKAMVDASDLEAGDEIAAFDGELCVGAVLLMKPIVMSDWTTFGLIVASRAEGEQKGYTPGDAIQFRIWDKSLRRERQANPVVFLDPMTGDPISPVSFTPNESTYVEVNWNNQPPVADAGPNQPVDEGSEVILDGTGSSDPDDDPLTYRWSAPPGFSLSLETAAKPSFIAPEVPEDTEYLFILVVNDGQVDSAPDTVIITVRKLVVTQNISLTAGWNIFSTYLIPLNLKMDTITRQLINDHYLMKVQDESGNSLEDMGIFGGWANNIGDIQISEGYKIKVSQNCQLTLTGKKINLPVNIALKSGWNIISLPRPDEVNGMAVVQQLIDRKTLLKVQDQKGSSIENMGIFGGWQNNIGNFKPGEGYKVKVTTNETLTIYESYPKSTALPLANELPVHFKPTTTGNGIDHMNIHLVEIPEGLLEKGDEIGVFDGNVCVGSLPNPSTGTLDCNQFPGESRQLQHLKIGNWKSQITNPKIPIRNFTLSGVEGPQSAIRNLSIPVSASDGPDCPGFTEGNPIVLKVWKSTSNKEYKVVPAILRGTSTFVKHESSLVSLKNLAIGKSDNLMIVNLTGIRIYPNPTTGKVNILSSGGIPEGTVLSVVNTLGQELVQIKAQDNPIVIDLSQFVNGLYTIRITCGSVSKNEKIVMSK